MGTYFWILASLAAWLFQQPALTVLGAGGPSLAVAPAPGFVSAVSKEQVTVGTNPTGQTACPAYTLCVPYAEKVLSGNIGIILVQYGHATSVTFTATDDQSNTYTCAGGSSSAGGNSTNLWTGYCYALNLTNSPHIAEVTFGTTAVTNSSASPHSFYNIATSGAIDGSVGTCAGTSGTTANCGSVTPTVANDLILQFVCRAATPTVTSFTAGSGYTFGAINNFYGCASQFKVDSGTGSITPSMTMASASTYTEVVIALKAASAGTQPTSGTYPYGWVQRICSENNNGTFTTLHLQCPSSGNFLLAMNAYGAGLTTSAVTSANTWKQTGTNSGGTDSWYAAGASADNSGALTLTIGTSGDGTFTFYDVSGAPASPNISRALYGNGAQSATSTLSLWNSGTGTFPSNDLISFIPTPTAGLTFAADSESLNTVKGASAPSSCLADMATFGGESLDGPSGTPGDENNGWMHCSISTGASTQYAFTLSSSTETGNSFTGEVVGVFGSGATAIINAGNCRGATVSSVTCTVPATTSGTTSLIAIADFNSTGRTISTVAWQNGTGGTSSFTPCTSCVITTGTTRSAVYFDTNNPSGATSVKVTLSASASQLDVGYLEVQKGTGSFAEDVGGKVTTGTGSGTVDTGASVNTTGSIDIVAGVFNSASGIAACPNGANEFSWVSLVWNGGNDGGFCALLTTTATGHQPTATDTGSGSTFDSSTESLK